MRPLRPRRVGGGAGAALGNPWLATATVAGAAGLVIAGAALGRFDDISLMVEYRMRFADLSAATAQHLVLSFGALALSFALAGPLAGRRCARGGSRPSPTWRSRPCR